MGRWSVSWTVCHAYWNSPLDPNQWGYDSHIAPVSTAQRVIDSSCVVFKRQGPVSSSVFMCLIKGGLVDHHNLGMRLTVDLLSGQGAWWRGSYNIEHLRSVAKPVNSYVSLWYVWLIVGTVSFLYIFLGLEVQPCWSSTFNQLQHCIVMITIKQLVHSIT